jgi:hypothetical protein
MLDRLSMTSELRYGRGPTELIIFDLWRNRHALGEPAGHAGGGHARRGRLPAGESRRVKEKAESPGAKISGAKI